MTIFQTRPYLMAYRRHFGVGKSWHRLRLEDGSAAYLMSRGRTARRLEWWGAGIADTGACKYLHDSSARELWSGIETLAHRHHATTLNQVREDDILVQCARETNWTISPAEACPVLELPATWDEYVRSLGKNMREQIKRYPKRLAKEFSVETELARTPAQVQSALNDLFRLHAKRWRARGQSGVLATPRRQKFHRDVCAQFLKHDYLRLWSLKCNDKTACVLLSYKFENRYSFFIGGFEPDLMRWSVGTCLFAEVLKCAIEEGATQFDFLRGEEEYKYRLGAQNVSYVTLSRFGRSPRSKYLHKRIELENRLMHQVHLRFSAAHAKSSGKKSQD